jgi:hypothetical protein
MTITAAIITRPVPKSGCNIINPNTPMIIPKIDKTDIGFFTSL